MFFVCGRRMDFGFVSNPLATLNVIEEKMGSSLQFMGTEDHFINIIPISQTLRETINKWHLLKQRHFCEAKDIDNTTKMQPTE